MVNSGRQADEMNAILDTNGGGSISYQPTLKVVAKLEKESI